MEMIGTFRKMLLAIMAISQTNYHRHCAHQNGIIYQFVYWRPHDKECDSQLTYSLQDADIGKRRHSLMCYDCSIVWYTNQINDKGDDGELKNPVGRRHPVCRYGHLCIKKSYANRLYQDYYNQRQQQLYGH